MGLTAESSGRPTGGLPVKFMLRTDLMDLTFERGVGIVEARMHRRNGSPDCKLDRS